jgi:hypothetical protein
MTTSTIQGMMAREYGWKMHKGGMRLAEMMERMSFVQIRALLLFFPLLGEGLDSKTGMEVEE